MNNVGVRRRIGLKIVETLSVYLKKNVSCVYSSRYGSQNVLGCFINLLRVKLSFTLERAASNEYPLQTFSLRNKKERFGYPLVLTLFQAVCIASGSRGNMKIGKWWMNLAKGGHNFVTF